MTVLALHHREAFRDEEHAEGNLEEAARDGKSRNKAPTIRPIVLADIDFLPFTGDRMFRRVARRQASTASTAQIAMGIRRLYQRGIESF